MNKKLLQEGLDYHDLVDIVSPIVTVDEYAAKIGDDSEIVTLAFEVENEQAGNDLTEWFEKGYDFVLDSQVSEGENEKGKYLVFVELERRLKVPQRIIELLDDLYTLTDIKLNDWVVMVDNNKNKADIDSLKKVIKLSPHEYKKEVEKQEELNEFREIAGLSTKPIYKKTDEQLKAFTNLAGL